SPKVWFVGAWQFQLNQIEATASKSAKTTLRHQVELSIPGPSIPYPMERTQDQKRPLGNALSVLIPCLLFGRETHASTTQSDPLLLPTRNGPYREDGALRWEYLF